MDALLAGTLKSSEAGAESTRLARAASLGLVALVWLVAALVAVSRVTGAMQNAPSPIALVALALLLILLAAAARQLLRAGRTSDTTRAAELAVAFGPLPAMILTGWAVAVPGASGVAYFVAIVLVAEAWALRHYSPAFRKEKPTAPIARRAPALSEAPPPALPGDHIRIDPPQSPTPHFPTDDVAQQLVRRVDAEGNDLVEGWVRAVFETRQRTASAHVLFYPTLEGELSIDFEQVDGVEARVKAAELLPYGVRFDVKLPAAAERAESVLIEFVARGDAVLARAVL